ncbi:NAD(P)/FAD-dependent oxidoreductase [Marinobacter sp. 2_MG-2023]|uniref:NAD(P)/FAD-dependent oxidoreductase n=1 Tax=Marinobacter sp. 2_MG-2023 TaxID=3062679 RepID=UPI0026E17915|nr:FAD-dependent oxidoreductase [Marinobacter sp. 2_MG-2023]MDO6442392.1 FAD-dependent oxidoreductase [Marinobacter sp. 2_MG-2023]
MFNETFHKNHIRRIAIVGSGLAGLTAAIKLQRQGHKVTIFEKSRGPGGRLSAKRVDGGSVDMGAQYFTSRNPDFLPFLAEFAGEDSFATWNGQLGFQSKDGSWQSFPEEPRYVGTPRMTALSRALSVHVNVIAETRIERMLRTEKCWILYDITGEPMGQFDQVIITTPPAQARDLLAQSELPQLAAQLDDAVSRVLPCWAVAVQFSENPWPRHSGMRCDHPALFWVANNSSKPGRDSNSPDQKGTWWVLHATPEWTNQNVDAPADRVTAELIAAFRELTGTAVDVTDAIAHRWLYARSEGGAQPGHLWFEEQAIGVAGDWLGGGRVEGAFDSACSLVSASAEPPVSR